MDFIRRFLPNYFDCLWPFFDMRDVTPSNVTPICVRVCVCSSVSVAQFRYSTKSFCFSFYLLCVFSILPFALTALEWIMESPQRRSAIPIPKSKLSLKKHMSKSSDDLLGDSGGSGSDLDPFMLLEENIALKEQTENLLSHKNSRMFLPIDLWLKDSAVSTHLIRFFLWHDLQWFRKMCIWNVKITVWIINWKTCVSNRINSENNCISCRRNIKKIRTINGPRRTFRCNRTKPLPSKWIGKGCKTLS